MKLFTRENITLAIAIFGALGTLLTWFFNFIHSRKNIDLRIIKISKFENQLTMYLSIQNKSRIPISINSISLLSDGVYYPCDIISHPAFTVSYQNNCTDIFTIPFPVNLGSLTGTSGYIEFDISSKVLKPLSTPLTVQVSTNRGKAIEKKLHFEDLVDLVDML